MQTRALSEQPPPGATDATAPSPLTVVAQPDLAPEVPPRRISALGRMAEQEWAPALLFFICDVVCWVGIYGSLSFLRHDAYFSSGFEFAVIDIIQLVVIVQSLFIIGGYSARTEMRGLTYTAEHILAMIAALAGGSLLLYTAATFDQTMKPSRSVVLASFIIFTPISLVYRRTLRRRVAEASANRAFLVIGVGELASNFYQTYRSSPNQQRLEFVDPEQGRVGQRIAGPGSPIIEGDVFSKLGEVSKRYSGIILAESMDQVHPDLLDRLVRTQFQRTRVYTLESFYEVHWRHVPTHSIDPFWPLQTGFQLSRASPYHYLKRLFDLIASGLLLVICFPLIVLLACLVWLTSGRPAIFRQARVGREGDPFTAYKFRTMRAGAGGVQISDVGGQTSEVSEDDIYTRPGDPRVTPIGRWMRKLRLDELPQLWNVFRGQMSLIGPRAEWIKCAERYEKNIPFYHFRHLVKPGITGWAQVNYPYGESEQDAVEKLKYDLYYIRHYSLTLDAMIVLKTIHTMLFGKGR
jgi:exopolysaccharide biosynthesis polyprenyl glycosylphosphotransferase